MLYLRRLNCDDGEEIYNMLQEIARDDNGFRNKANGMTFDEFRIWLKNEYAVDNGKLEDWMVPQTSYWLYDGDKPIGYGRIRHYLNDALRENSGHIGYAIRKSERGLGYGNRILGLLLEECKKLEINDVQISAHDDNIPSNKVIVRNGGILKRNTNGKNFYGISI